MKNLFWLVGFSLLSGAFSAQASVLNGTWAFTDYRCENGLPVNADFVKILKDLTRKFETSFTDNTFSMEIEQGPCSIVSSGSYTVDSDTIQMNITDVQAGFCAGAKGSFSVHYAVQNNELQMYQPAGFSGGKICGAGVRAIQVLVRK